VHFAEKHMALTSKMQLSPKSRLLSLNPFLDEGVRLQSSQLDFDAKHPMILPKFHRVTSARFWPIGGRKTVSAVISKCIQCFRLKLKLVEHIMVLLLEDRVQPKRPFVIAEVDFC